MAKNSFWEVEKVETSQEVPAAQGAGTVSKSSTPCWRGGEWHVDPGTQRAPKGAFEAADKVEGSLLAHREL